MAINFNYENIDWLQFEEPATPEVLNRPTKQVDQNVRKLRNVLQNVVDENGNILPEKVVRSAIAGGAVDETKLDTALRNKINDAIADTNVHIGDSAPSNPVESQRWFDTKNNTIWMYKSGSWIELTKDRIMTKAEFEALAEIRRKQYAGSGFVYCNISRYEDGGTKYGNFEPFFVSRKPIYGDGNSTNKFGLGVVENVFIDSHNIIVNVNGYRINLDPIAASYFIKNPQPPTSLATVADSTNLPVNMKQGDFVILKDLDRELVTNGTFDNGIEGWVWSSQLDVTYDNGRMKIVPNSLDSMYANVNQSVNCFKDVLYEIKIDIEVSDNADVLCVIQPSGTDGTGRFAAKLPGTGSYIFRHKFGANAYMLYIEPLYYTQVDRTVWIDNISVKQVEEAPIVALQDVSQGIDIYENADKFEGRDSVSRQDLVFLETWHEDISEKDIVYPYGNIQYRGDDTNGLTGIAEGTFTGADTYSLFGNWQQPGELIGKGYKWSNLTEEQKILFASNPENNVYKDGKKLVQVRYRVRVVKGLGNTYDEDNIHTGYTGGSDGAVLNFPGSKWPIYARCNDTGLYYDANLLKYLKREYITVNTALKYGYDIDPGAFVVNGVLFENHRAFALPIVLVQRRNSGAYHPVYNPEGTAKFYEGGNAKEWWELETLNITSLEDCFNPEYLAVVNKDDATDAAKYSDYLNGNIVNTDAYALTGLIESKVSGRPDGLYADEINERDVEDLRMSSHKKPFAEILDEWNKKAIAGEVRGKENDSSKIMIIKVTGENIGGNYDIFFKKDTIIGADDSVFNDIEKLIGAYNITSGVRYNKDMLYYISKHTYNTNLGDYLFNFYKNGPGALEDFNNTNVGDIIVLEYRPKSYTYNNTLTHCDIIGDPRQLQDRVKSETPNDATVKVDLSRGDYILCTDNTNNNGTVGHYYVYTGPDITNVEVNGIDGTANATDGHIDFSDTSIWTDLGSDGTIGGYPQDWLDKGFSGTPLIVSEEGESLLPIQLPDQSGTTMANPDYGAFSIEDFDNDGNLELAISIKASRKYTKLLKVLVTKKDGTWVELELPIWYTDLHAAAYNGVLDDYRNKIYLNLGEVNALGYNSFMEALALMRVVVFYETKANFLEVADNNTYINRQNDIFASIGKWLYHGNLLVFNLINKVPTNTSISTTGGVLSNAKLIRENIQGDYGIFKYQSHTWNTPNEHNELLLLNEKTPGAKFLPYLTQQNNRAYLQYVFKELKFDTTTNTWGDDNKFQIINKVSTITDLNGNTVLYGQKRFPLPYFITEN